MQPSHGLLASCCLVKEKLLTYPHSAPGGLEELLEHFLQAPQEAGGGAFFHLLHILLAGPGS